MTTIHRGLSLLLTGAPLLALALSSCTNGGASGNVACTGDFGSSVEARRLESFLRATGDFHAAAIDTEADLRATCRDMGVALGMSDAEIFAGGVSPDGSEGLRAACASVEARIHSELAAIRASGTVAVTLEARAPRCDVSVDAYASCVAECDANIDAGSVELVCEGGELRGTCDAQCTGSCAVDVAVACSGRCEGICDGECSVRGADGDCAGTCDGVCHGQCVVSTTGSCAGECRGTCSVRFTEPRCTGTIRAPMASVECAADCDARVAAMVTCTPGEVHLAVEGALTSDVRARADRLVTAFEVGASGILELRARAAILWSSGSVLVSTAAGVPGAVVTVGASAFVCATAAAVDTATAAGSLAVSVDVSVHVSGTVSGSADR